MAAEAGLILLLIKVRVFRTLPAFFVYICWSLVSDGLLYFLRAVPSIVYFRVYEVQLVIDSTLIFAVLVELGWSVLRPIRASLPKHSWIVLAILIAVAGFFVWPLARLTPLPAYLTYEGRNFFLLQQTFAILRVIVFLAMAGCSQLLSIGWRNRELQVATGLGFFSIVSLAVAIIHTHQSPGTLHYHWLDEVGALGYLGSLIYWVVSFTTKEAERQNFSPQMENFLLLIGGSAKAHRVALGDIQVTESRRKDDR